MPTLTIDTVRVRVEPGTSILQAAARAGITIPTLCRYDGIQPPTSCFVCVVKVHGRKGLVPSCVAPAEEGMVVESDTDDVRAYRTAALELLLSEHAGDCEAPCRRICPCDLDIPAMARAIVAGSQPAAVSIITERMPFPAVLGYICPAPCQKGCRRGNVDTALSIRDLHRRVGEAALAAGASRPAPQAPPSGKSVAIVGAGPAGMSAAWYLSHRGHRVMVYDSRERPGGMLAFGVSRDSLPLAILDGEIDPLKRQGVRFTMNTTVGRDLDLEQVEREFDAVVLATGAPSGKDAETAAHGVSLGRRGIAVQPGTFLTSRARVFACGGAIVPGKLAARSVGQGRSVALVIDRFLVDNDGPRPTPERFDAHLTGIDIHEIHQLATSSVSATMDVTPGDFNSEIAAEAGRCLSCDCSVKDNCDLRRLATDYGIDQRRYRTGKRKRVVKTYHGSGVVFEPGKCLSCGRCVGITAKAGVRPGLSFHSRGFDVVVGAPFGAPVDQAMGKTIDACIAACPTGALSRIACLRGER